MKIFVASLLILLSQSAAMARLLDAAPNFAAFSIRPKEDDAKICARPALPTPSVCSVAAIEVPESPPAPHDPYAEVLDYVKGHRPDLPKLENTASPFNQDHYIEQRIYTWLYERKYRGDGRCAQPKVTTITSLPKDVDADGHPLWFDGGDGRVNLYAIANAMFQCDQYEELDRLFDDWSNLSERMADGRLKLFGFDGVFGSSLQGPTRESAYQKVRTWRTKSPRSVAAAAAEALYWLKYAGDARGSGFADTVTAEGWALYEERAQKSEAVLRESQPFAQLNPYWRSLLIEVGLDLNWPKDRLLAIFQDQTVPQLAGFATMAKALTPKWGGSWGLVEDFARDTAERNRVTEGYSMYARIYDNISCDYGSIDPNIFHYTSADWSRVKRGFDDMKRLYPHSAYNLNRFAALACMADEKATFQSVRFLIGKNVIPSSWPSGYSPDLCEHKFALQPL